MRHAIFVHYAYAVVSEVFGAAWGPGPVVAGVTEYGLVD